MSDLTRDILLLPGYDPHQGAAADGLYFDVKAAKFAVGFIENCCTHIRGELAGQPFTLQPWERGLTANLFGWKRPDGTRRYRETLVFVPRKQGKTTWAASILNYELFCDDEPGAEIYCAASTRDQATLVFSVAAAMARNDKNMSRLSREYRTTRTMIHNRRNAFYRAIAADARPAYGFNAQCVIVDELHAQMDRELVDALMTSIGARRQPLVIHITTSDYEREGSICNEKHRYASAVRDGLIDDWAFLPCIYEASVDDDWRDPAIWAKANPNLGISIDPEYLARECERAKESPSYENTFKRAHLNIRTESAARWINSDAWEALADQDLKIGDFAREKCWVGLDLANTSDFSAAVFAFAQLGVMFVFPFFWVPRESAVQRERTNRIPYSAWQRAGHLLYTEGNTTDYDVIRRDLDAIIREHKFQVQEIAVDRLFQGLDVCRRLAEEDGLPVIEHGQGFLAMALPTKETERVILAGKMAHPDHPVLNWMISNTTVAEDAAGNRKPDKKRSTEKIDGVVAMIMAVGRALAGQGPESCVYNEREMRFV